MQNKVNAIQGLLDDLTAQRDVLNTQILNLQGTLHFLTGGKSKAHAANGSAPRKGRSMKETAGLYKALSHGVEVPEGKRPLWYRIRQAAASFGREFSSQELIAAMRAGTRQEQSGVYTALSHLTKKGDFLRIGPALYRVALSEPEEAAPTEAPAGQSRNAALTARVLAYAKQHAQFSVTEAIRDIDPKHADPVRWAISTLKKRGALIKVNRNAPPKTPGIYRLPK